MKQAVGWLSPLVVSPGGGPALADAIAGDARHAVVVNPTA
jgi:hypothetical protein